RTRGKNIDKTIEGWPSVRAGEDKNIYPFQHNADVIFNSSTIYELSVLKTLAIPHLLNVDKSSVAYPTASRLLKILDTLLAADGQCIPNTSIVKEFVGGSVF
ncbi:MAG: nucleoside kinase, partial [Firmicutes bacterium]|nr:nucleoside kinase [Bacillota bacterium]